LNFWTILINQSKIKDLYSNLWDLLELKEDHLILNR